MRRSRIFKNNASVLEHRLHFTNVLSRWASEQSERSYQGSRKARGFVGRGETAANQMSKANFFFASRFRRGALEVQQNHNRLANAAPLELQSPLVIFVFFSRYLLPMSNKFTTFVPEIK